MHRDGDARVGIKATTYVLALVCSIYFIVYTDRVNIATAAGAIKAHLGLSNTELGVVFSAYAYPYAVMQLLGGWLTDVLGPRLTLGIFGAIFSVATLLTGFAGSIGTLIGLRALLGLGEGPALASATRALAAWTPPAQWSFAQGLAHALSRVANATTPPIVAVLITAVSWQFSFVALGVVSVAWVATWLWYFRDDPATHSGVTPAELARLPKIAREGRPRVPVIALFRRMLPVIATDFCYGWSLFVFLNWLPSFFAGKFGLNLNSSAAFTSGIFVAGIVADILGGVLSDRIYVRTGCLLKARRNLIAGGMAASMLFFVSVLFLNSLILVALALLLAFFCMELVIAPLWAVPMDIAPRFSGTASGFMNFGAATAGIVSPWVFGHLVDLTGSWTLPFACSAALMACGAVTAFWMRPDKPFEPAVEATDLSPAST
ncbi:MFS transporter [Methylobacterium sp. SD21]|uniref:MFS transporter n=1 Tax=Methylobacterium litchii TaxID=3138810 RepID=UPI00313F224D